MSTNSKDKLIDKLVKVTVALSELHELVDKDQFALDLFEQSMWAAGALPVSLDDFIAEWQTAVNQATLDTVSLFNCWKKSASFYMDISPELKEKANLDPDMTDIKSDDIVFEDGSYINTGTVYNQGAYALKFYVQIGRDCASFFDFNEAADYLWKNHAKEGYGV